MASSVEMMVLTHLSTTLIAKISAINYQQKGRDLGTDWASTLRLVKHAPKKFHKWQTKQMTMTSDTTLTLRKLPWGLLAMNVIANKQSHHPKPTPTTLHISQAEPEGYQ